MSAASYSPRLRLPARAPNLAPMSRPTPGGARPAPDPASPTREALARRDAADKLAPFRDDFLLPEGVIYLDGNSLGALPGAVPARLGAVIEEQWGRDLVRAWNSHDWVGLPARVGEKIAPLIGASPGQVVAADSTSVNLFKLLCAAQQLRPGRRTILTQADNFPTDMYIAQGVVRQLGGVRLRRVEADGLAAALDDDTAVLMLTHVDYRSGRAHDMAALTEAAHRRGAVVLWDLAHSAGALPLELDAWGVDLAVGCGYKYLNGGPGAPAFLYVARRHQEAVHSPLAGWFGHADPFAFAPDYAPAAGITRLLCGTPPVLSMAALEVGVELIGRAGMAAIREKSLALTGLFMDLVDEHCAGFGLEPITPRDPAARGSQVSLRHPQGYAIMQALIARGVIGDFRAPDVLRFGVAPLYLRHVDIWDAVMVLAEIMATGEWGRPRFRRRAAVT